MAPPLPSPGAVLRLDINWQMENSVQAVTRLFASYSGSAPNAAACNAMASGIAAAVGTDLMPLVSTERSLAGVSVMDLSSSSGAVGSASSTAVGSRTGAPLPPGVALTAAYHIARRYRGGKPRSNWPFFTATDMGGTGEWGLLSVGAAQSGLTSFFTALLEAGSGGASITNHVNVSYYSGFTNEPYGSPVKYRRVPTPRGTPLVDPITSFTALKRCGSQRKRNR